MLHLHVHPENPQQRLIEQAVERIRAEMLWSTLPMLPMQSDARLVIKMRWNGLPRFVV